MENCATAFILAKKGIESQYMNDLSCMQGFEILDGLLFNAKTTKSRDSLEWYKIALDALIKMKKVDESISTNSYVYIGFKIPFGSKRI